ncbi:uncharacterized protein CC84DRAFT_1163025 [Paraphaeosphaeria sporulosa]|uniref:Uncharacterized protein n=1 Tax=Paraphaeosphaeria sporulosa TaxID=1460663 RepID=A0A177CGJ0_9PLEO|nr:uncharacterized protein CC84DRAFT_1163025 [Paraphaeosphaeria sporulosa]OAG06695.1 hypothetical protein CC84DRAFT_1163025 [Paraphaeosphaeria sporulosa]
MCTVTNPADRFYNDRTAQEQQKRIGMLLPNVVHTQTTPINYAACLHHPVTYLFSANDAALGWRCRNRWWRRSGS